MPSLDSKPWPMFQFDAHCPTCKSTIHFNSRDMTLKSGHNLTPSPLIPFEQNHVKMNEQNSQGNFKYVLEKLGKFHHPKGHTHSQSKYFPTLFTSLDALKKIPSFYCTRDYFHQITWTIQNISGIVFLWEFCLFISTWFCSQLDHV